MRDAGKQATSERPHSPGEDRIPASLMRSRNLDVWISFGVFFVVYLSLTFRAAALTPLWMDEVLSVWTSRLPSMTAICSAVEKGSGFSPPVYHLALHYYSLLAGGSNFALRLPSILAMLITAFLAVVIIRRHLGVPSAVFAACLMLELLSPFGVQVRPYTLVTFCYVAALLLWEDLNLHPSIWRSLFVGIPLAVAVSLHFYAVLFVPCLGIIEILRSFRTQERRYWLWLSLTIAGASVFLWLPYMRATYQYNLKDIHGATNGPRPTIDSLVVMYSYLFQGLGNLKHLGSVGLVGSIVITTLGLQIGCRIYSSLRGDGTSNIEPDVPFGSQKRPGEFWDMILGTLLLPLVIFLFSALVTRTFNLRYVIAGSFGACALYAELFSGFSLFRRILPTVLLTAGLLTGIFGVPTIEVFDHTPIYGALPGNCPIVVADGQEFFQLEESAPDGFRTRLIYLTPPPGVPVADPNDLDAILRWKSIDPNFPVESTASFLSKREPFYVLDERTSDDTPASYLSKNRLITPFMEINGAVIYRSLSFSRKTLGEPSKSSSVK